MTTWINGQVKEIKNWSNSLFSLLIKAPIDVFISGQFAKLALEIAGKRIQRAYSYVNSPNDQLLEFYIVMIKHGYLTPYLRKLRSGDCIMISKEASGFFILDSIPTTKYLWMIATGTGIGPYLSILQYGKELDRFKKIVLVHAVRYIADLNFLSLMNKLKKKYGDKLLIQTVISREKNINSITGRIPYLIESNILERTVGLPIDANTSHIMLCGNPQMVFDTQELLQKTRNMHKNFQYRPGNITSENYW